MVQVSSFGADELKIVYNSKEGKLMLSEKQFNELKQGQSFSSDKYTLPEENETYKQYLKKQAGIAYYEAYAPIYDPALLEFEKPDGTIDVEAIEKVNPDMLKLIGYRIPTEATHQASDRDLALTRHPSRCRQPFLRRAFYSTKVRRHSLYSKSFRLVAKAPSAKYQ